MHSASIIWECHLCRTCVPSSSLKQCSILYNRTAQNKIFTSVKDVYDHLQLCCCILFLLQAPFFIPCTVKTWVHVIIVKCRNSYLLCGVCCKWGWELWEEYEGGFMIKAEKYLFRELTSTSQSLCVMLCPYKLILTVREELRIPQPGLIPRN